MKPSARVVGLAGSLVLWAWIAAAGRGAAVESEPAITPAQIEADWLRQDEVRGTTSKPVAAGGRHAAKQDAAGGVDGLNDGKWGFHTENEHEPLVAGRPGRADRAGPHRALQPLRRGMADRDVAADRAAVGRRQGSSGRPISTTARVFYGQHRQQAAGGEPRRREGPLRAPATARHELLPSRRGARSTRAGGDDEHRPGQAGHAEQHQPVVGPARRGVAGAGGRRAYRHGLVHRAGTEAGRRTCGSWASTSTAAGRRRCRAADAAASSCRPTRPTPAQRQLYLDARWAVRQMALANPLLDFDTILFVKRCRRLFPAHVRPVLRLVVAARRRRLSSWRASRATSRSCAA